MKTVAVEPIQTLIKITISVIYRYFESFQDHHSAFVILETFLYTRRF